jgi:hypothetical protein
MSKHKHNKHPGSKERKSRDYNRLAVEDKLEVLDSINQAVWGEGSNNLQLADLASTAKVSSGHDVFFGGDADQATQVAVKCYTGPKGANRELENLREAERRGFTIIEPFGNGVYDIDGSRTALVTKFVPRLVTMDNEWGRLAGEESLVLQYMGVFAGKMHKNGIIHGDLQPKNIGQVFKHELRSFDENHSRFVWGEPVLFDLEGDTKFYDPNDQFDTKEYERACREDLINLIKYLAAPEFMDAAHNQNFEDEITGNLLASYIASGGTEFVLDQFDWILHEALYRQGRRVTLCPDAKSDPVAA